MTKKIHELNLSELKQLYDVGRLSRNDLLVQDQWGGTVFHNLAEYNPDAFNIFPWLKDINLITKNDLFRRNYNERIVIHRFAKHEDAFNIFSWLKDLKWITKDDLFKKDEDGYTVLHLLTDHEDALPMFSWLKDLEWIIRDNLFIKDDHGKTVLHFLARNKDALSIFKRLKDIEWITKDDLFRKNKYGSTVLHWLADNNKDALSIFEWLVDLKWITKNDLFIKHELGTTILDYLSAEEQEKVLALFDKKNPKRLQCRLSIDNVVNVKDTNCLNHWGYVDFDSRDFDDGDELEIRIKRRGVLFTVTTIHSDSNEKWKSNVTDTFRMHPLNMAKKEQIEHECQFDQDENEDD